MGRLRLSPPLAKSINIITIIVITMMMMMMMMSTRMMTMMITMMMLMIYVPALGVRPGRQLAHRLGRQWVARLLACLCYQY